MYTAKGTSACVVSRRKSEALHGVPQNQRMAHLLERTMADPFKRKSRFGMEADLSVLKENPCVTLSWRTSSAVLPPAPCMLPRAATHHHSVNHGPPKEEALIMNGGREVYNPCSAHGKHAVHILNHPDHSYSDQSRCGRSVITLVSVICAFAVAAVVVPQCPA